MKNFRLRSHQKSKNLESPQWMSTRCIWETATAPCGIRCTATTKSIRTAHGNSRLLRPIKAVISHQRAIKVIAAGVVLKYLWKSFECHVNTITDCVGCGIAPMQSELWSSGPDLTSMQNQLLLY